MQGSRTLAVVDGQFVNVATLGEGVEGAMARLESGRGFTFLTLNLDHLVRRRLDASFRDAYAHATFVSADGQPVVRLARRGGAVLCRTTGADLVVPLCRAAGDSVPVFLFGTDAKTLDLAGRRLASLCPRLQIAGLLAPPMGFDPHGEQADQAAATIAASGAKLCFVALPAAKQVAFMARYADRYQTIGFVGVGAAIDFLAGTQRRAPKMLQDRGLEWAWRLASSPRAMFGRYLDCGLLYLKLRFGPDA